MKSLPEALDLGKECYQQPDEQQINILGLQVLCWYAI